jgi:hypothetical protein
VVAARRFDPATAHDAVRSRHEHDLEQHGRRIRGRSGGVVPEPGIEVRQINRVIEQVMDRVLERAGE